VRVAVIGAGAIGAVVAAAAADAGHDVVLCVRTPIDSLQVETDAGSTTVRADIVTIASGPLADVVFVAVKAIDVASTQPHLAKLCGPRTLTVAIQNGLDQAERVLPYLPEECGPTASAIAYMASELVSPGRVKHIGGNTLVVPEAYAQTVIHALGTGVDVRGSTDMVTASWEKLLGNLVANPITSLTLRHMDVMTSPGVPELARSILTEAVTVAMAEGARLDDNQVDVVMKRLGRFGPETGNSMLYDRMAGRPTEHQFLTGEVVRRGTKHGIPVPVNTALLALLEALSPSP
jgi:2-dehydropantoate 2-reductase